MATNPNWERIVPLPTGVPPRMIRGEAQEKFFYGQKTAPQRKKMAPQRKKMEALDREIASRNPSRQYRGQNSEPTGDAVQAAAKRSNEQYRVMRGAEEATARKARAADELSRQAYLEDMKRRGQAEARSFIASDEARAQRESRERREARKKLPARQRYSKDFASMVEGWGQAKKMFNDFMATRTTKGVTINGKTFTGISEARVAAKQLARENRIRRDALETAQELGLDTKSKGSAFAGFDVSAGGALTDAQKTAIAKGLQSQVDAFKTRLQGLQGGNYATYQAEQRRKVKEIQDKGSVPGSGSGISTGTGTGTDVNAGRGYTPHMTTLERDALRKEEQTAQRDREYRDRQRAEQARLDYALSARGAYDRSVADMNDLFQQAQADQNRKVIRGMKSALRRAQQFGVELSI